MKDYPIETTLTVTCAAVSAAAERTVRAGNKESMVTRLRGKSREPGE